VGGKRVERTDIKQKMKKVYDAKKYGQENKRADNKMKA